MNNVKPTRLKFDRYYHAELFATQGDTGRTFALEVLDDYNKPMNLTGAGLRLYVAAGEEVTYADGTIDDAEKGKATVTLYNSQLKFPGKQKAQFVLTGADGHKIGSKIFDLYVEKELAAGPTLGKNLYVDFEAIEETLTLIKNYDKTLEEAKEVDLSLKVKIDESVDTRAALTACKEKALKIKSELEDKTAAGTREKDALDATNATAAELRTDLTRENSAATNNIATLTDKISKGGATTGALTQATETAGYANAALKSTTQEAAAAEKTLKETNATAEATRKNLSDANETGGTLSAELSKKISTGETLKGELDDSTTAAGDKKSTLDETIETAESREGTLKAADTEAQGTVAAIRELMDRLDATKGEVNAIIASGDLGKYVTDPVLTERLKAYVTKEAMQASVDAINTEVEKKADESDVPTALSQLENDRGFKTNAEIQAMINAAAKLKKEVVTALPSKGDEDVIYLVKDPAGKAGNYYLEYLWIGGKYELIGSTQVDLSGYVKKAELPDLTPYAKNEDIKTRLADMEEDSEHRTVTDDEKRAWSKKVDIINDLTTGGADKALSAEQGKTLFTYADNGKKSIADAIVGKGVDATKDDSFNALAYKISNIKTGYGVGDVIPEENVKTLKTLVPGAPEKVWEFTDPIGRVLALAVGPDGSIYSGSGDKKVFKISVGHYVLSYEVIK